jgi:DNA polymerase-1
MESKTLILIDGHALAYRQYFALERTGMKTSENIPTWAIYGFFKALFDLLRKVKPDAIAVSFDTGRDTFRTKEYPEYKAHRQAMPDSLRQQMKLLVEGINDIGIPIYQMPGFEADDIIGTIAEEARDLGHKVLILTGDQDSFQLLDKDNHVSVLIPYKGELLEYDRTKVFEKLGVWPEQIADYKGLSGDSSDNIPGVKGIGDKTAVKLLSQYGSVENTLDHIEEISPKGVKEKLETDREMAIKSKYLATIDRKVPIEFDFEHTHLSMPDMERLTNYLRKLEFFSFLKQLPELLQPFNNGIRPEISKELLSPAKQPQTQQPSNQQMQLGLFQTQPLEIPMPDITTAENAVNSIINTEQALNILIDELTKAKTFSLDTETTGIDVYTAELVGISCAWNPQITTIEGKISIDQSAANTTKTAYIPVGHKDGLQLKISLVLEKLKPLLENKNLSKILQNAKYDINLLNNYDISVDGVVFDTMLASYIKNPTFKHNLKSQALSYLKFEMKTIEELIGKGKDAITMADVSIEDAASYASDDAKATLELARYYSLTIDKDQNEVLYGIEMPLVEVLADIEKAGISVDTVYLKTLSDEIGNTLSSIESQIYEYAGEQFNINSPKQVADIIFEKLELSKKAKTKTGYSTNAKVLESLSEEHPIIPLILEQRHLSKLKSTYIDALPLLINPKDNRIHTSFNQTITTTGRLSSSNPNLQNIPIRTELGNRIRAAFVPSDTENSLIMSADYSQIELRLLAHYSKDPALVEAFCSNKDIHTDTASRIFDVSLDEVTKDMRRKAKAVNFGIIYGQSSFGLSGSLGISPGEAKRIINKYFEMYPKIRSYMETTKAQAYENGYVTTMFGRKRYLAEELSSRNKSIREFAERAAINAPLQGTAADLIKLAMIQLYQELNNLKLKSKMILQVHDELVLEVPKTEVVDVGEIVKKCMELCQPLTVPLIIDIACAPSWMEA